MVEGSAMLVVMVPIVVLLILCLLNTYFVTTYNLQVQAIAAGAARQVMSDKWWLGMTRTDYSVAAEANAADTIREKLAVLGLKLKGEPRFTYSDPRFAMLRKKDITIVRVEFDVDGVKIAKGSFFVPGLTLHGCGVSSDAEHCVTRHGQALLQFRDPQNGWGVGIRVPAYNATIGRSTPAHPDWLRCGKSSGDYPVAYLRVKCPTTGSTLNRSEDVRMPDGTVDTRIVQGPIPW